MEGNINAYLNRLYEIIAYDEKNRTHYEYLRENTYNLFSNFLVEPAIRTKF